MNNNGTKLKSDFDPYALVKKPEPDPIEKFVSSVF